MVISLLLVSMCILQRKRRARAQNVVLLQAQRQQYGGPPPPGGFQQQPYGSPYGGPPNNGFGGPQPFQPGYQGGYMNNGAPPMHPEAKGFVPGAPGATPGVAEPPRSYNPDQPYAVRLMSFSVRCCLILARSLRLEHLIRLDPSRHSMLATIHLLVLRLAKLQERITFTTTNLRNQPSRRRNTGVLIVV